MRCGSKFGVGVLGVALVAPLVSASDFTCSISAWNWIGDGDFLDSSNWLNCGLINGPTQSLPIYFGPVDLFFDGLFQGTFSPQGPALLDADYSSPGVTLASVDDTELMLEGASYQCPLGVIGEGRQGFVNDGVATLRLANAVWDGDLRLGKDGGRGRLVVEGQSAVTGDVAVTGSSEIVNLGEMRLGPGEFGMIDSTYGGHGVVVCDGTDLSITESFLMDDLFIATLSMSRLSVRGTSGDGTIVLSGDHEVRRWDVESQISLIIDGLGVVSSDKDSSAGTLGTSWRVRAGGVLELAADLRDSAGIGPPTLRIDDGGTLRVLRHASTGIPPVYQWPTELNGTIELVDGAIFGAPPNLEIGETGVVDGAGVLGSPGHLIISGLMNIDAQNYSPFAPSSVLFISGTVNQLTDTAITRFVLPEDGFFWL